MGVAPYMVATSLIGVVAQRLVKCICPKCRRPRMSTDEENQLMHITSSVQIYDAVGCPECNNTGYKGRTAIHEIIHCTSGISTLIAESAGKEQLEEAAKKSGAKVSGPIPLPTDKEIITILRAVHKYKILIRYLMKPECSVALTYTSHTAWHLS